MSHSHYIWSLRRFLMFIWRIPTESDCFYSLETLSELLLESYLRSPNYNNFPGQTQLHFNYRLVIPPAQNFLAKMDEFESNYACICMSRKVCENHIWLLIDVLLSVFPLFMVVRYFMMRRGSAALILFSVENCCLLFLKNALLQGCHYCSVHVKNIGFLWCGFFFFFPAHTHDYAFYHILVARAAASQWSLGPILVSYLAIFQALGHHYFGRI